MKLHGVIADAEAGRNLAIGVSVGDESQHLALARGELLDEPLAVAWLSSGRNRRSRRTRPRRRTRDDCIDRVRQPDRSTLQLPQQRGPGYLKSVIGL